MSFSSQISKFTDKADDNMEKVVRMSFIELSSRIIRRSPVGDASFWKGSRPKGYTGGRFRANWQASINAPAMGAIDTDEHPETGGSVSSNSVTTAAKKKRARSYYLMNNLPYAKAIEEGHSRQAPNGIIKLAVAEWQSIVRIVTGMVK